MRNIGRFSRRALGILSAATLLGASACGGDATGPVAAVIALLTGGSITGTVGQVVSAPLTIEIRDSKGKALTGIAFTVTVNGGGTLVGTPAKTTATTSLGTWTLGTVAGLQSLVVTSGSATLTISATAQAGPASSATTSAPSLNANGAAGAVSSLQPSVTLKDAFGNAIAGRQVTVQINGGGSVQNPNPTTDASGTASVGKWTYGTTAGEQTVVFMPGGSANPVTFRATVAPGPPTIAAAVTSTTGTGTVGATATTAPTIKVTDAFNNPIAGISVTATASAGSSVQVTSGVTGADGTMNAGTWTLGTTPGNYTVTMTAQGFPPVVFTATASAGAPATIAVAAGSGQTAAANAALPVNPSFRVSDQFNNSVSGANVVFVVLTGGGSLASATAVTNAQGVASPGIWTLGPIAGQQSIRATVGGLSVTLTATATGGVSAFNIEVRYVGAAPSVAVQAAFTAAATRIQQVITSDVPSASAVFANLSCGGVPIGALNEVVDDIVVFAQIAPIDGVGGTLGQAGPCVLRPGTGGLPAVGIMQFDDADLASMQTNGTLSNVILHEMFHTVGFGTLWSSFALRTGATTANSLFIGPLARAAYVAAGGSAPNGVPLENCLNLPAGLPCGAGTQDVHWKESVFTTELMTGYASAGFSPLSGITVQSAADLGYGVSIAAADPYSVPPPGIMALLFQGGSSVVDLGRFKHPTPAEVFRLPRTGGASVPQKR